MDKLAYLNEIFALIVGILIGTFPFLIRFILNRGGKTAEAAGKVKRAERFEQEKPRLLRIREADLTAENGSGIYSFEEAQMPVQPGTDGKEGGNLVEFRDIRETHFRDWKQAPAAARGWDSTAAAVGGWRRIENLPHLKRAVILSEILGPPLSVKGFDDK
jgi:hypothetical protein